MVSVSLDWLLWIVGLLGFVVGISIGCIIYHMAIAED